MSIFSVPFVVNELSAAPLTVIDVGAAGGVQETWRPLDAKKYVRHFGFEASPINFEKLVSTETTRYFHLALSDTVGVGDFYARATVGSLVRRVDRERVFGEEYEKIEVQIDTLEHLRKTAVLPSLDVIKTDVERHDLNVLRGAGAYLGETLCVISEFEYYVTEGGNSFKDIDGLLTSNGFLLFSLAQKTGPLGELAGGDLLYVRDVGELLSDQCGIEEKRRNIAKLITVASMLDLHQYVDVISRAAADANILDAGEFDQLRGYTERRVFLPLAMPKIPGSGWCAHALALLAQVIAGRSWGSKSAPRGNALTTYRRLTVGWVPPSWRKRYATRLDRNYAQYKNFRGIFFKDG